MRIGPAVETAISAETGTNFKIAAVRPLGGGCINQAYAIEGAGRRYFVKTNRAELSDMFEAEAEGLKELESAHALRVPHPIASGVTVGESFLVLEFLELGGEADPARMGQALARQHRHTSENFGWHRANTIGSTPQQNHWADDWIIFLQEYRFGYQLRLAATNGLSGRLQTLAEQLMPQIAGFFPGYRPVSSLLHGDLWGGNADFSLAGEPVVFDPAVYYGDREADLAMTELFGGFGAAFYAAYREAWPIDPGYPTRKTLYNLYHILNQANLFGGAYISQAETMMQRLLSELH